MKWLLRRTFLYLFTIRLTIGQYFWKRFGVYLEISQYNSVHIYLCRLRQNVIWIGYKGVLKYRESVVSVNQTIVTLSQRNIQIDE